MNINWKLRFGNKVTLYALIAAAVNFIYSVLQILNVVPQIDQNTVLQGISVVLSFLAVIGVINDPTTAGMSDSQEALKYSAPK